MTRFFNALIGVNLLLPWIVSLILPIQSSALLNEALFFGTVFVMAVGNARLARLLPDYSVWIWALSIGNLLAAAILGHVALATVLVALL
jgi:hypothetical protein